MLSLDEIFFEIVTLDKTPRSIVNVRLIVPSDHKEILEVIDIEGLNSIKIEGLNDSDYLEVGSWIRISELKGLKRRNKQINFIVVKESV